METINIASLNKTFGIKGEFKAYCLTDFPRERFRVNQSYLLINEKTGESISATLSSYRLNPPFIILRFLEIPTINEAEKYLGWKVAIPKENASLPEDYFHIHDLIGCQAYDEDNNLLGECIDVFSYSSTYTLRIRKKGQNDLQIPFVKAFIKNVDIEGKRIEIHLIEGML